MTEWLANIRAVTFDCYGTLIDWERGILAEVERAGPNVPLKREELMSLFAEHEREAERGVGAEWRPYAEVLGRVSVVLSAHLVPVKAIDLATSLPFWPAFEETPEFVRWAASRWAVGILSNVDEDLFAQTVGKLGRAPDVLVTAEQVRSYKPRRKHFYELLRRTGLLPGEVLHVAESVYHDIEPAGAMGMRTAYINRRGAGVSASGRGRGGGDRGVRADVEAASLTELRTILEGAAG